MILEAAGAAGGAAAGRSVTRRPPRRSRPPPPTAPRPHPGVRRGRRGRRPRRGARARGRARRLHRRLPRRRPRQEGRAGRALADPGRGLPQRRLHPVQGAAARGQGHRRDQGDGRARPGLRRARDRPRQAARLEGRRRHAGSPAAWPGWPSSARSRWSPAPAASPRPTSSRSTGDDGSQTTVELRAGDHRRRLGAGDAAVHPARRPAGDRLHRRPGAGRRARAAAGHRRRHHRPGDGHRLRTRSARGSPSSSCWTSSSPAPTRTWSPR